MTTADLLLDFARKFRDRVDLDSIQPKLRNVSGEDRREAMLFSVYHLLFSGAVAEANIEHYLAETWDESLPKAVLPGPVETRAGPEDRWANFLAWKGTEFGDTQNIIGALAFSVVALFFFEGFCKLVLESQLSGRRVRLNDVFVFLREDARVTIEKLDTAIFLNRYRNAWHSFGQYSGTRTECKGVSLTPGHRLPILSMATRDAMLTDLLDLFLEVDSTY